MKDLPPSSSLVTAIKSEAESSMDEKLPPPAAVRTMQNHGDYIMDDKSDDASDHQDIVFQHSWDGGAWNGGSLNKSTIKGDGHDTKVASGATSTSYGISKTSFKAIAHSPRGHQSMTTTEAIPGYVSGMFGLSPHRHHDLDTAQNLLETVDLFQHDECSGSRSTAPVPARRRSSSS
jgi:hypothetical protein